jgi:hypothetical protein
MKPISRAGLSSCCQCAFDTQVQARQAGRHLADDAHAPGPGRSTATTSDRCPAPAASAPGARRCRPRPDGRPQRCSSGASQRRAASRSSASAPRPSAALGRASTAMRAPSRCRSWPSAISDRGADREAVHHRAREEIGQETDAQQAAGQQHGAGQQPPAGPPASRTGAARRGQRRQRRRRHQRDDRHRPHRLGGWSRTAHTAAAARCWRTSRPPAAGRPPAHTPCPAGSSSWRPPCRRRCRPPAAAAVLPSTTRACEPLLHRQFDAVAPCPLGARHRAVDALGQRIGAFLLAQLGHAEADRDVVAAGIAAARPRAGASRPS